MVPCQTGPTRHACAWQIGPFWQDTLELWGVITHTCPNVNDSCTDFKVMAWINITTPVRYKNAHFDTDNNALLYPIATATVVIDPNHHPTTHSQPYWNYFLNFFYAFHH